MKQANYVFLSFLALLGSVSLSLASGTWVPLAHPPPGPVGHFLLLSDGTVMAQANPYDTGNGYSKSWYRLVPDSHGSYVNGTWTNMPSMNYTRLDFATVVLQDGRVFVAGGEYGTGENNAEVYDPVNNTWTMTGGAPSGQTGFVDSEAILLANGNVLIAPVYPATSGATVIYDTFHNTLGPGPKLYRADNEDEATWVKLPDDSILTVDSSSTNSERYIPSSNTWVNDANVPVSLYDPYGGETGAGLILPNGKAIYFGGTTHTAIHTPSGSTSPGSWAAGPDFPNGQGMADGPAAMLVNGRILCVVGPVPYRVNGTNYVYNSPMSFYEYDYFANSFTQVNAPGGGTTLNSTLFNALLAELPDGSVLFGHRSTDFYVYRPDGAPLAAGKPSIAAITTNSDASLHLVGTLFNGLCQGASYGDDEQMDSNFPLVRFTDASGIVRYGRSHNWSRTSVMTGSAQVSTECNVPVGASVYDTVQVVVNGIASDGVSLSVTTTNDSGPGSLRQAVSVFYPGATITFAASLSGQTIRLTSGEVLLNKSLNIDASALPAGITIDGTHSNRVFEVTGGSTVTLVGLTIANGYALGASGGGLAISDSTSIVLATNCAFSGNTARGGDGLSLGPNSSGGPGGGGAGMGGGIFQGGGPLVLSNCRFLGNSAIGGNGGNGNGNSTTSDSGAPDGGPNPGFGGAAFASGGAGGWRRGRGWRRRPSFPWGSSRRAGRARRLWRRWRGGRRLWPGSHPQHRWPWWPRWQLWRGCWTGSLTSFRGWRRRRGPGRRAVPREWSRDSAQLHIQRQPGDQRRGRRWLGWRRQRLARPGRGRGSV